MGTQTGESRSHRRFWNEKRRYFAFAWKAGTVCENTERAMSEEHMEIVRRIDDEGLIDRDPEKWLLELADPGSRRR